VTLQSSTLSTRRSGLTYPNRFTRALLLAMQEVMGEHGLESTLELANLSRLRRIVTDTSLARDVDFAELSALNLALDEMYGQRGGRGMALRAGRAWLVKGMRRFGALSGIEDPAFRTLPVERRLQIALRGLAAVFTHFSDQDCRVEETDALFRFVVLESPMCWGQQTDRPICHPLVGLLQETARFAGNGRDFSVREIQCRAAGADRCIFVIHKQQLA
jgi:predicted hydrocarbon binding protein